MVPEAHGPRGVSSISLATGSHLIRQEARHPEEYPKAAAGLNTPPREIKGLANRKCITSFSTHTSHRASPQSQFYLVRRNIWLMGPVPCMSGKPFLSQESRKEITFDLQINSSQYWEMWELTFLNRWYVSVCYLHTTHATCLPDLHYYLTFYFVNKRGFKRKL